MREDGPAGSLVKVIDVVASSPGPELVVTLDQHVFAGAVAVLDTQGAVLSTFNLGERGNVLDVTDVVAASRGPEFLLLKGSRPTKKRSLAVLSAQGNELYSVFLDEEPFLPASYAQAAQYLAVSGADGPFMVLDAKGQVTAKIQGFDFDRFFGAVDQSGTPVFVFNCLDGLVAYTLDTQ